MLSSILKAKKLCRLNISGGKSFYNIKRISTSLHVELKKSAEIEQTTQKHFKDIYHALNYLLEKKKGGGFLQKGKN